MMVVLQDGISNCTQSLGLGKISACSRLERKTAFRERLCSAAFPAMHSTWWELWERGARKVGLRGWLEPGLELECVAVSCKVVPNCTPTLVSSSPWDTWAFPRATSPWRSGASLWLLMASPCPSLGTLELLLRGSCVLHSLSLGTKKRCGNPKWDKLTVLLIQN